jgi:hypothetical protein
VAWTPEFIESGQSQFIDKLMVVVHRDMKPALDFFDALDHAGVVTDNLPDFAAMVRGKPGEFRYPLLSLALERMSSADSDSGEWLEQDLAVAAALVVDDVTIATVLKKAEKYTRAFRAVVRRGILECLPPIANEFDHVLTINDQHFGHGVKKDGGFTAPVQFEIKVRFGET